MRQYIVLYSSYNSSPYSQCFLRISIALDKVRESTSLRIDSLFFSHASLSVSRPAMIDSLLLPAVLRFQLHLKCVDYVL